MQPTQLQTGIWLCCQCRVEVNQVAIRWRLGAELRQFVRKYYSVAMVEGATALPFRIIRMPTVIIQKTSPVKFRSPWGSCEGKVLNGRGYLRQSRRQLGIVSFCGF